MLRLRLGVDLGYIAPFHPPHLAYPIHFIHPILPIPPIECMAFLFIGSEGGPNNYYRKTLDKAARNSSFMVG